MRRICIIATIVAGLLFSGLVLSGVKAQNVLVDDLPFCGHHDTTTFNALWDTLTSHSATVKFTSREGRFPVLDSFDLVIIMHHNGCSTAGFSYFQKTQLIDFVCYGGNLLVMPISPDDVGPHNNLLTDSRWITGISFGGMGSSVRTTNIASFSPFTNGLSYMYLDYTAIMNVSSPGMPFIWSNDGKQILAAISYPRRTDGEDCDCSYGGRILALADCHTFEVPVLGYAEPMAFKFITNALTALARVTEDSLENCNRPEGVPLLDSVDCASPGSLTTIYGQGFDTTVSVLFGDSLIYYFLKDSTEITITVPDWAIQGMQSITVVMQGRKYRIPIQVYCEWLDIEIDAFCGDIDDTVYFTGENIDKLALLEFGGSFLDSDLFEIESDSSGWFIVPDTAGLSVISIFDESNRYSFCVENEPTQRSCLRFMVPCPCPPVTDVEINIEIIKFFERLDGTDTVYIVYNFDSDDTHNILIECSFDGGLTWDYPCISLYGDIGDDIAPGDSLIIKWDAGTDAPNIEHSNWAFRVTAVELSTESDTSGNYIVRDSDDAGIAFDWVDIADGNGVDTLWSEFEYDDVYKLVTLGFDFVFYIDTFCSVYVTTNGLVGFDDEDIWWFINNTILPDTTAPNNFIAPFWDDLYVMMSSCVYAVYGGEDPYRWMAVIWRNMGHYLTMPGKETFWTLQLIMNEDGSMIFQYLDLEGAPSSLPGLDYGGSATVGIENSDGTDGIKYSANRAVLSDSFRIEILPEIDCQYGAIYSMDESEPGPIDTKIPLASVTCPSGGDVGELATITWTVEDSFIPPETWGPPFPISLQYSVDGGLSWTNMGLFENDGSYDWTYPTILTSNLSIQLCATDSFGHMNCAVCGSISVKGDTIPPTGYVYADTCSPDSVFFVLKDDSGIDWSTVCILDPLGVLCYPDSMDIRDDTLLIFKTRLVDSMLYSPARYIIRLLTLKDDNGNIIDEELLEDSMAIFFRHPCCWPLDAWRVCPVNSSDTVITSCDTINLIFAFTDTAAHQDIDTTRIYISQTGVDTTITLPLSYLSFSFSGDTIWIEVSTSFPDGDAVFFSVDSIFTFNGCKAWKK